MRNKKEIFDSVFYDKGGRFSFENHSHVKPLFERVLQRAYELIENLKISYPNLPEIYVDFINSTVLNACATKYEGNYFIGINAATVLVFNDMFMKMLAHKDTMPDFGDVSLESDEKCVLSVEIAGNGILMIANDTGSDSGYPKDKFRYQLAYLFLDHTVDHLIYHECAHIIRGHVDFVYHVKSIQSWNEFDYSGSYNGFNSVDSQTLEMDADSLGTNRLISNINYRIDYIEKDEFAQSTYKDWHTALRFWGFSIYSMFRLFNVVEYQVEQYINLSHPPANVRIHFILANVATIFLELYPQIDTDTIVKTLMSSCVEAEAAFSRISYQSSKFESVQWNGSKDGRHYYKVITDNWNNIRPLLVPYAYGELPKDKIISDD